MREEIKLWIDKAEHDFETAKFNFKGKRYDASAFFCQQAAEKALKSVYIKKFESLLKVHDLVLLCKKVGASQELIDVCKSLTSFYIETRYPSFMGKEGVSEGEATGAIKDTEKVIEWVKKNL